ncbi:alpha-D-ribose 1-methylphosphonate 5-triphosphate diphosphatase [Shimia sp. R11_0]|uniref:alpha-D-ribose 1-methylphosphonate 5-triphosphate diphosphatase n=1 Tax=Shimia sp. R11_0 TaxID=2821096 RepID=UPI001ADD4870|nr:alpha-D-ribose 1-methylphosphonate 5-triphosphate diphosphatase [Shimia sp. R11_0]MBO9478544.1 alpha-D-ribose 1-methylphosphonate 5-triphosphate diphosphatase [Shimia sp. R11_0]
MSSFELSLRLTGAKVLCDGALQERPLAFHAGKITDAALPEVDLSGYLLLPGIIDLHGDAFERHIAPRPSAPFPMEMGLRATDRDAAANGVTTAWLAQSWSWEGGHRGPEAAESLMAALDHYRTHAHTDLRIQIRCETHTTETHDRLLTAIKAYEIDYVVFNNHLEEALMLAREKPEEIALWAKKAGRTAEEHMALVRAAFDESPRVPRYLCSLAEQFDRIGVHYGSHDDPDGDTRERYSVLGARICEFPTTRGPAAVAKAVGDHVIMGAPNIVRGGSQAGNIQAARLVADGLCDALVSDYHYPALSKAAFRLVEDGLCDLPQAWAMISSNPAAIMDLEDRGTLDLGKRADIAIVHPVTHAIEGTIVAGHITHLTGTAARRFFSALQGAQLAAE